jgi:hypothetical protein
LLQELVKQKGGTSRLFSISPFRFPQECKTPLGKRGFAVINRALSKRAAATVAPEEAPGADAFAAYHDDLGPFDHHGPLDHDAGALNHDDFAIGTAETLAVAVETSAASIGRVRGPKACKGAGNQSRCKKVFHVFFLYGAATRRLIRPKSIRHVRYLRHAERRKP